MTRIVRKHPTLPVRSLARVVLAALAAGALLVPVRAAHAAATPEQACQSGRYKAAEKFSACEQKATGKYLASGEASGDQDKLEEALSKCRVKYTGTWVKLQTKASGTGATCDASRFSTDGLTVNDRLTGLEWEVTDDTGDLRDEDNTYTWSAGGFGGTAADGTVFTDFLRNLNDIGGLGYHGQSDWRLPTRAELQTILTGAYLLCTAPCVDAGFGPTAVAYYWSATTDATHPDRAWDVFFANGEVSNLGPKISINTDHARAVRGGL